MTAAASPGPTITPMTRREFLYYVWGASMALFMAEMGGALVWFALPRFRAGEFGGVFTLDVSTLPQPDTGPKDFPDGRFWLVNLGSKDVADPRQPKDYPGWLQPGLAAIYKVCVHLGCLYKWVPTNNRFECPCHGSKYLSSGLRVDGPARRNLDRFIIKALDASGNVLTQTKSGDPGSDDTAGAPFQLPAGTAQIQIDTGKRMQGAPNTKDDGGK